MRLFSMIAMAATVLIVPSTSYAASCDMWGTARANRNIASFDLKAMAEAAKENQLGTIRNCYGTEQLKTDVEMSPFGLLGQPSTLEIQSRQTSDSSLSLFKIDDEVYKLKTQGNRSELLGDDNKWHDIEDLSKLLPPLEALGQSMSAMPQNNQWLKSESDAHLAPISEALMVTGVGGLVSAIAMPYLLQYAPLADSSGIQESIGGYSTTIWKINNQKAEMYAASKGIQINTTGSHIHYWVTDNGLVIKMDAKLAPPLSQRAAPMIFKYRVAKSAAPDPSWPQ